MSVLTFVSENLPFLIFVLFLTIFLYIKRKNLEVQRNFPFLYLLMYKTKVGLNFMKSFHKKYSKLTDIFILISSFLGITGTIFVFLFMFWQLYYIVVHKISSGGGLVLPLKTSSHAIFYVPFLYWIISIFVLALVHEFAHGIVAEKYKINIKSSGFAFLGIIVPLLPAAFVEPDEKKLQKSAFKKQLAVLGAGPASNVLFGLLFLGLFLLINPLGAHITTVDTLGFTHVMNRSTLNNYNLSVNGTYDILKFDNMSNKENIVDYLMKNISFNKSYFLTLKYNISNCSGSILCNKTKTVVRTFEVEPFNYLGKPLIGISGIFVYTKYKKGFERVGPLVSFLIKLLFYLWVLNISIGLINLLPLWITDGGQILRFYLIRKYKKNWFKIYNTISWISLILIILTIFPSLIVKFFALLKLLI